MHAELQIGDSVIFVVEESGHTGTRSPQSVGAATSSLQIYVVDDGGVQSGCQIRSKSAFGPSRHVLGRPVRKGNGSIRTRVGYKLRTKKI